MDIIDNLKDRVRVCDNLILFGDVHTDPNGKEEIDKLFEEHKDIDCIALELDYKRYDDFKKGKKMFLFKVFSLFSKRVRDFGKRYALAVKDCIKKEKDIPIELIDTKNEIPSWIAGILLLHMALSKKRVDIAKELEKFEEKSESKYVENVKKNMIYDRDKFMVNKLKKIIPKYKKILVVVGYGHLNGIVKRLNDGKR